MSKAAICSAIRDQGVDTLDALKSCTKAGTGCGGCLPLVTDLLKAEMKLAGKAVVNHLCEHFKFSRTELFAIIKAKQLRTFSDVIAHCGSGNGCEICKPAIASILASLWNENIMNSEHQTLQDTNDRFMANMQRGGLYSVVPRVPGGEITPDKLRVIADVAKRFGLYTKITGGQRIDLFGAQRARPAGDLGIAGRMPALKVGTPTAKRCAPSKVASAPLGAATACRIPSASRCEWKIATREFARRTKSKWRFPDAFANAPRRSRKTSA